LEFHGDLTAKIAAGSKAYNHVKFGFCMKPNDDMMDCLVATTNIDIERIAAEPVFAQDFTIEDSKQDPTKVEFETIKKDAKFSDSKPDTNFQPIAAKSRKGCTGTKK